MKGPALAVLLLAGVPAAAAAQNALDDARAKYESASYEEALASLATVADPAPANRAEIEQYRALCLLALGNMAGAEKAVTALVEADPNYHVPASVASPKVLSTIAEMRGKQLPAVARRLLDEGRTAYENKDFARARQQFDMLAAVVADPAMEGNPERDNLQTLARAFATLVAAAVTDKATAKPAAAANVAANAPSNAAPADAAPASPPPGTEGYTAPVAIKQQLPPWEPPSMADSRSRYSGTLRLRIGADGTVKEVIIARPSHPAYDARLLTAARTWIFKPATLNGVNIESVKTIAVELQPVK